jgi:diguanylate cyclase (GGDEF)-like protein
MDGSHDHDSSAELDELPGAQRARDLLRFAPLMPLSTAGGSLVVTLCLWPVLPTAWLVWLTAGLALACLQWQTRVLVKRSRARGAAAQSTLRQRRWVIAHALGAGAFWGITGVALFPSDSPGHQLLLAFVLTAATAAWLPFFALVRSSLFAFAVLGLLPMAFELLISPQTPQTTMGSLLILLIGALALVAEIARKMLFADSAARRALYHQATHDPLVGLANRAEFHRRVRTLEIMGADAYAIVYIDLDHFKAVNDSAGHAVGDELLRRIGEVLRRVVRQGDTPARLGGDEFAILMEDCSGAEAAQIATTLLDHIRAFRLTGVPRPRRVTASIGIACSADLFGSSAKMLEAADQACYRAKRGGRNRVEIATGLVAEPTRSRTHAEFSWLTDLSA